MPTARKKHTATAYDLAYQARPSQVKKRVERNRARAQMTKKLGAAALRGKEVDHIRPLASGGSGSMSNLRVRSVAANRGDKSMFKKKKK